MLLADELVVVIVRGAPEGLDLNVLAVTVAVDELVERLAVLVLDPLRLWENDQNFCSGHGRFGRHSLFNAESHAAADARRRQRCR